MRRAALIYNPVAGRRRRQRVALLDAAAALLRQQSIEPVIIATTGRGSAGEQASAAVAQGCDVIFACGGDGTMHDILQGLVPAGQNAGNSLVPLGVLPMGTGNVLAQDMRLPSDPLLALRAQLAATPRRVAIGRIECARAAGGKVSRYFCAMAGIGADAEMAYRVTAASKDRLGIIAYLYQGGRVAWRYGFPLFTAEYLGADGARHPAHVSQLAAVRINNFGGVMRRFAPGAGLERDDLQLVLFKTRRPWDFFLYMLGVAAGRNWQVAGVDLVHSREIDCFPLAGEATETPLGRISVEADGEYLGKLPARITIVPDALSLLLPR